MKRIAVEFLAPGMVLSRTLYNEYGSVLLRRGMALNSASIETLKRHGFTSVGILNGIADDLTPAEEVSERVRAATRKHLRDLFRLVQRGYAAPAAGTDREPENRRPAGTLDNAATAKVAAPLITHLCGEMENIVEEVLDSETVDGVVSLKSHDNYTFEHSVEVTVVGLMLARRLHFSSDDLRTLALGCLLHDIGKLAVPAEILNRKGRLTPTELDVVKQHPQNGYDLVTQLAPTTPAVVRNVVLQHHERQDGTGYPHNLHGRNSVLRHINYRSEPGHLLLAAEIAAVADTYSALASDRPYRPAMEPSEIVAVMTQAAGHQLNAELVNCFLSILPIYPNGTEVRLQGGKWSGYQAVVTGVSASALDRPAVRLLRGRTGSPADRTEIDLRDHPEVRLSAGTQRMLLTV
ncbi:MAG: HD-GYP domain-containing protein [Chloroflexota bacterium]